MDQVFEQIQEIRGKMFMNILENFPLTENLGAIY